MKRFLILFVFTALLVSCGSAKSVSYTYKPLTAEGCSVSYSALQQDGQLFIAVTVKSDRLVFTDAPTIMFKNFDGEVLKLEGTNLQSRTETSGVLIGSMVLPVSELNALVQFPITPGEIDFFKSGIAKVRLSTIPIVHERTFSNDKIGRYLHSELLSALSSESTF